MKFLYALPRYGRVSKRMHQGSIGELSRFPLRYGLASHLRLPYGSSAASLGTTLLVMSIHFVLYPVKTKYIMEAPFIFKYRLQ